MSDPRGAFSDAEYDIFLASPLTVSHEASAVRAGVENIRDALICYGGFTVFCAATYRQPGGSRSGVSFQRNLHAVNVSRHLLLIVLAVEIDISSIWIELGMAMALERPVIIAAPDETHLPFLARRALDEPADGGSALVRSFWHNGDLQLVNELVASRGPQLFESFFERRA